MKTLLPKTIIRQKQLSHNIFNRLEVLMEPQKMCESTKNLKESQRSATFLILRQMMTIRNRL